MSQVTGVRKDGHIWNQQRDKLHALRPGVKISAEVDVDDYTVTASHHKREEVIAWLERLPRADWAAHTSGMKQQRDKIWTVEVRWRHDD